MRKLLLAAAMLTGTATSANAAIIYGVNGANELVTFNSTAPGVFTSTVKITGAETLKAIDFRLNGGGLYGLTSDLSLVRINLTTGAATTIGSPLTLVGTEFGFDFNQGIDRIRVVSNANQNYVLNPDTGALQATATPLAYAGTNQPDPDVVASAYTANAANQLYGIDSKNDRLVTQNNNGGVLVTVGSGLGFDVSGRTSFDIARDGTAYVSDDNRFYTANLATGRLSFVGTTAQSLFAISAGDNIAAVPEPATWAMMIGGVGMVGGSLRRVRRRASGTHATA